MTISGAATITDAHLTKDYCGPITPAGVIVTVCPGPDDPFGPDSPKGTALPVPKYKTNWTARYEFPLEQFQAHVQGGLVYQSSSWPDLRVVAINPVFPLDPPVPIRAALGLQQPYTTFDFTAGIETERWSLELSILNAFDERAQLYRYAECTVQTCAAQTYIATNRPRTIGLRFGQKF